MYARSKGYFYVGRGSGANSLIAYCLGITDVDPLELDLYFERFINLFRETPPDFDLDFSWKDRDDVTDYIFRRYGTEHTTLLATYTTFKDRSFIREVAKTFGLPEHEITAMVKNYGDTIFGDAIKNSRPHCTQYLFVRWLSTGTSQPPEHSCGRYTYF